MECISSIIKPKYELSWKKTSNFKNILKALNRKSYEKLELKLKHSATVELKSIFFFSRKVLKNLTVKKCVRDNTFRVIFKIHRFNRKKI